MITTIDTAPVMSLCPQDIESLRDELQAYHAMYSPLFQRREHVLHRVGRLGRVLIQTITKNREGGQSRNGDQQSTGGGHQCLVNPFGQFSRRDPFPSMLG